MNMNVWLKEKHLNLSRHYRNDFCDISSNDEGVGFWPCTDRILYNLYFKGKQLRILFSFKHIRNRLEAWSCELFASPTQKRFKV